jgi:hypothetical protein
MNYVIAWPTYAGLKSPISLGCCSLYLVSMSRCSLLDFICCTTVDGHGNRDIIFSWSDTYSAFFQKKGEGQGKFLTLNIVQPFNHTVTTYQEITKHGIPLAVGTSISLTKQITDLRDSLSLSIHQDSNSSSNAKDLYFYTHQPINTTLRMKIIDPKGATMVTKDSKYGQSSWLELDEPLKPDIAGKYTYFIKNIGNSPVEVGIKYGSDPSETTITTQNVTNTKTTTAQFGTVSISGSC